MGYVKGEARHPGSVFPVAFDERVPDDHVCPMIEAFVAQLDLVEFECRHAEVCATGRPPWDPADLPKLDIYGYLHQTRSSRKLEPECQRTVDVMGLLARLAPDFKTLARVREANPKAVRRLCAPCVPFCRRAGWVSGDGGMGRSPETGDESPWQPGTERTTPGRINSLCCPCQKKRPDDRSVFSENPTQPF